MLHVCVGDLDLLERRKRCTSSRAKEEEGANVDESRIHIVEEQGGTQCAKVDEEKRRT